MAGIKDINQEKAAQILFVLFLAAAMWAEFAPQVEPGSSEFGRAQLIMKSDPSPEQVKEACSLYASAVRSGYKDATFGLADCVERSYSGTQLERNMLRYAILTNGLDAGHESRSARKERDAISLTDEQKKQALKIDLKRILAGDITVLDLQ